jgi:hypothetical protein
MTKKEKAFNLKKCWEKLNKEAGILATERGFEGKRRTERD